MHGEPPTVSHCRLMFRKHIVPALGERVVANVEYKDILAFHNSLHHMPTIANRAADILVKMFNPCVHNAVRHYTCRSLCTLPAPQRPATRQARSSTAPPLT